MIKTKYFKINKENPETEILKEAAAILKEDGIVAFPTETVYGLGANAFSIKAIEKIYEAKGRPSDNPLIVHIASSDELDKLTCDKSEQLKILIEKYWPGPLTVVVNKKECIPDIVTGGLPSVAVRLPSSKIAQALIKEAKVPLAAPSANISGRPSPTNGKAVLEDLNGKIDMILDAGTCFFGVESTVIDLTGEIPIILRPGSITYEMLTETLGKVEFDESLRNSGQIEKARSPGMKYIHYAPRQPLYLVEKNQDTVDIINKEIEKSLKENKKIGVILSEETNLKISNKIVKKIYGSEKNLDDIAVHLYESLRYFDEQDVDFILVEGTSKKNVGFAIMNRLQKAATDIIKGS